jgi:uncharacterized protein (DUF302 family)
MVMTISKKIPRIFGMVLLWTAGAFGLTPTKGDSEQMTTRTIQVKRFSVVSSRSFEDVTARLNQKIGHPDMTAFRDGISKAQTPSELEAVVNGASGSLGLMEFARHDLGRILRKQSGADTPKSLRLIVGNPLIMTQLVRAVPDSGSYAPVTILIDERPDGVRLSYDRMASVLASYRSTEASRVARELDLKIEGLLKEAAR